MFKNLAPALAISFGLSPIAAKAVVVPSDFIADVLNVDVSKDQAACFHTLITSLEKYSLRMVKHIGKCELRLAESEVGGHTCRISTYDPEPEFLESFEKEKAALTAKFGRACLENVNDITTVKSDLNNIRKENRYSLIDIEQKTNAYMRNLDMKFDLDANHVLAIHHMIHEIAPIKTLIWEALGVVEEDPVKREAVRYVCKYVYDITNVVECVAHDRSYQDYINSVGYYVNGFAESTTARIEAGFEGDKRSLACKKAVSKASQKVFKAMVQNNRKCIASVLIRKPCDTGDVAIKIDKAAAAAFGGQAKKCEPNVVRTRSGELPFDLSRLVFSTPISTEPVAFANHEDLVAHLKAAVDVAVGGLYFYAPFSVLLDPGSRIEDFEFPSAP